MSVARFGWASLALVLSTATLLACGGAEPVASNEPVTLGEWCDAVGESMCRNTANKCFSGMGGVESGCRDSFTPSCLRGRDRGSASQRMGSDLTSCVNYIESRSCNELGSDTGQAMTGTGTFAQLCTLAQQ